MNRIAYVVAHIDTSKMPPVVTEVAIYSESARTLTGAIGAGRFAFDVLQESGADYEDAVLRAAARLVELPAVYGWAASALTQHTRESLQQMADRRASRKRGT